MSGFGPPPGAPVTPPPPQGPAYRTRAGLPSTDRALVGSSHRPGIVSLRPMTLGDVVDGAVKHIRRNPGPVLTASLVVLLVAAVPAVVVAGATARGSWYSGLDAVMDPNEIFAVLIGVGVGFASLVLGGALSYSVGEAVLGRRPGMGEMWAVVRGRLLPLVGLATIVTLGLVVPVLLLILLVAVSTQSSSLLATVLVAFLGGLAVLTWDAVLLARTCLAGAAVVLERRGALAALSRSLALTRRAVWRTLVRIGVVALLSVFVFWVVQLPLLLVSSLLGAVLSLSPSADALMSSVGLAVATILSMTVVVPFAAGATALHYVDQRMRLEGFDVVLQRAARSAPETRS